MLLAALILAPNLSDIKNEYDPKITITKMTPKINKTPKRRRAVQYGGTPSPMGCPSDPKSFESPRGHFCLRAI